MKRFDPFRASTACGLALALIAGAGGIRADGLASAEAARRPSAADAVRFLEQSTFGPTETLISHLRSVGYNAFLAEQFAAPASPYPDFASVPLSPKSGCPAGSPPTCFRDNYTMYPLQVRFFQNALQGEDQLRQRVALALHEILIVSGVKVKQPGAMAPYLDMLLFDAFGNYRQILADVTLNPAMGHYLDMVDNDKPNPAGTVSPNENYAREVMQLFSIGVNMLNPDGTVRTDASGNPIPTYTQETVEGFAHVFTGWTYAPLPGAKPQKHNPPNFLAPLWLYRDAAGRDANHDKGAKQLLSYPNAVDSTLPPNQDGDLDLNQALDNIFHHPNVGPYIGKQLIQHLVTSNPSPGYVSRVAAAFANDGSGVRGDMKAVITAILTDPEARGARRTNPDDGHLREPVLFITGLCRAFNATSDGILARFATSMGQELFNSPSVFSYYPHEYQITGTSLQGPEFGIQSSSAAEARVNLVNTLAFSKIPSPPPATGTSLDLLGLKALAGDVPALVGALNRLLLHGSMSTAMTNSVTKAVVAIPGSNPLLRAQTALYLVASSSQYQVAR